jgi:hypothetical protein
MLDAPHVDSAFSKLFAVERRTLGGQSKRAFEPRSSQGIYCRSGQRAEQSNRALRIRA